MLTAAGAAATMVASQGQGPAARPQPRIPRWRGFNLSGWSRGRRVLAFSESDFEWMAAWGFNSPAFRFRTGLGPTRRTG